MTPDEIIDLLSVVATYDQRTVGQSDVEAWLDIAEDEHWTYPLARRAVREHHRRGADKPRITPAAITDAIEAARVAIRQKVVRTDVSPPPELRDDPAAEIAWKRVYVADAVAVALNHWAETGQLGEPLPATAALEAVSPEQLNERVRGVVEDFEARSRKALAAAKAAP